MPLIECVPNISEGRRLDVIGRVAGAVRASPAVRLLDLSSDGSHNRSVLTMAGESAPLMDAVLALFEAAVATIDLRTHAGVHPRLGAVDVVPFVPLDGASMADCVALARATGAEVARRFDVPVYLYEEAATDPSRRNLAHIRRGQFEGLAQKMASPGWSPDYGPAMPHPSAGASAVGARRPLVAYNINLATGRLDVVRQIASAVRHSSGGLPFVKAMGVMLPDRGIAQVSMNLTNYEQTPILRVFDAVKEEAARRGVNVLESEIVGLVPEASLVGVTAERIQLAGLDRDYILEHRLRRVEP